ncbi:MAG: NTP transferase domain-containing protein [Armatimonadetes bacterium]|nr:NTP transferase domain-containing protein [Armatimonadota bacterium]
MKGVVLAAGIGNRMKPITEVMPKPMVPIANRPVLEHVVRGLVAAGVEEILVVVNYLEAQIRAGFGDGARLGARISYIRQENPKGGTGAAALLGEAFVGDDPFLLTFGDLMLSPANYGALVESYRARPTSGRITGNWMDDPSQGAAITIGDDDRMVRIVEKPPRGTEESNWNNSGVFVFRPAIFEAIRRIPLSPRGELELTAAIQWVADRFGDVTVYRLRGLWSDVGTPAKVLVLNHQILSDPDVGVPVVRMDRLPLGAEVDATSAVAEGADLDACRVGDYTCIAGGARVGPGAALRRSALFPGAAVGAGARLEYAIVMQHARVPDGAAVAGTAQEPAVVL